MQFLGDGIFAVDGKAWSDARALLRPQFVKQRLSDIGIFEQHISTMIELLPKDGKTFDIMDWWFRFALDASTEYLFGESVHSLVNPKVHTYSINSVNHSPRSQKRFHVYKKSRCYVSGLDRYGDSTFPSTLYLQ